MHIFSLLCLYKSHKLLKITGYKTDWILVTLKELLVKLEIATNNSNLSNYLSPRCQVLCFTF